MGQWEQKISQYLETISTHPAVLGTVSSVMNLNSYRKNTTRHVLRTIWKNLELPNKNDQDKTLYLINELQFKIRSLEREVLRLEQNQNDSQAEDKFAPLGTAVHGSRWQASGPQ